MRYMGKVIFDLFFGNGVVKAHDSVTSVPYTIPGVKGINTASIQHYEKVHENVAVGNIIHHNNLSEDFLCHKKYENFNFKSLDFEHDSISINSYGTMIAVSGICTNLTSEESNSKVRIFRISQNNDEWEQVGEDINGSYDSEYLGGIETLVNFSGDGTRIALSRIHRFKEDVKDAALLTIKIFSYENDSSTWKETGNIYEQKARSDLRISLKVSLNRDGSRLAYIETRHHDNSNSARLKVCAVDPGITYTNCSEAYSKDSKILSVTNVVSANDRPCFIYGSQDSTKGNLMVEVLTICQVEGKWRSNIFLRNTTTKYKSGMRISITSTAKYVAVGKAYQNDEKKTFDVERKMLNDSDIVILRFNDVSNQYEEIKSYNIKEDSEIPELIKNLRSDLEAENISFQ